MIKQVLLVSSAILISVLIYTARRTGQETPVKQIESSESGYSVERELERASAMLSPSDKEKVEALQNAANTDSLISFWDHRRIDVAAHYASQQAENLNSEEGYIDAAIRYFDAFKIADDSLLKQVMVEKAIEYYEKALEKNPDNLNVQTDLGVCYAEGTPMPMRGITMLLKVVEQDPKHENAQLNLGFLSVKSGQYDKALLRFDNVLEINPLKAEVHLFKAQTFLRMNDQEQAIASFEKFTETSSDPELVREVKTYLKQIKSN